MFEELMARDQSLSSHYGKRYVHLMRRFTTVNTERGETVTEKHHALPKSIYPEHASFRSSPWNCLILTPRQHFIAHWLLAKIFGGKMWFAFNQMKRVGKSSALYSLGRKYVSAECSRVNRGRLKSETDRKGISRRTRGTVVVRDTKGNRFRVSLTDERYVRGELVFYRTGFRNREETLTKMSERNGVRGRRMCYDNDGTVSYHSEVEALALGLTIGCPPSVKDMQSKLQTGRRWVTLPDGSFKKLREDEIDDTIHRRGRVGFKGWEHMNR